ncbi:MAG TPA: hypothetical protein VKO42_03805 [Patescibacteria group bacterium]|nr:hypothetical protein [Patescibacteria group bacterium]
MKAGEMLIDFALFVALIVFSISCFVYFILGDRFDLILEFLRSLIPFSFFGVLLAFKLKSNEKRKKKKERDGNLETELWFSFMDKAKSEYFLYSLPIIIIVLPILYGSGLDIFDVLKALVIFALSYSWQRLLFTKKGSYDKQGITVKINYTDKIKGDIMVFSLPLIMILLPSIFLVPLSNLDLVQAALVFVIAVVWQQFLFSKQE